MKLQENQSKLIQNPPGFRKKKENKNPASDHRR